MAGLMTSFWDMTGFQIMRQIRRDMVSFIGRVANRISNANITIAGIKYPLKEKMMAITVCILAA